MKISLAVICILAASCVLAAPKSIKLLSKAKFSAGLQTVHKGVRPLSARLAKKSHRENKQVSVHSAKHSEILIPASVVKEQAVSFKSVDGFFITVLYEQGKPVLRGSKQLSEAGIWVLVYLDSGKVAFWSPTASSYLVAIADRNGIKTYTDLLQIWNPQALLTWSPIQTGQSVSGLSSTPTSRHGRTARCL